MRLEICFNDLVLATGTGFFYKGESGYFLVTNRHNVTGRDNNSGECLDRRNAAIPNKLVIYRPAIKKTSTPVGDGQQVNLRYQTTGGGTRIEMGLENANGSPVWMEHPQYGAEADFVFLPFSADSNLDVVAVNETAAAAPIKLHPADSVSVIGYPFGKSIATYFPIWVNGFIASEPEFDIDEKPVMYVDCRTRPGSSGSPVFAFRSGGFVPVDGAGNNQSVFQHPVHRFLGIYSGRINSDSDIGIVWKAKALAVADDGVVKSVTTGPNSTHSIAAIGKKQ